MVHEATDFIVLSALILCLKRDWRSQISTISTPSTASKPPRDSSSTPALSGWCREAPCFAALYSGRAAPFGGSVGALASYESESFGLDFFSIFTIFTIFYFFFTIFLTDFSDFSETVRSRL